MRHSSPSSRAPKQLTGGMTPDGGTGDVKYHHGAEGAFVTQGGKAITVALLSNPSHLEFIGPVVDGRARAAQTNRRGREAVVDTTAALPVIIHGDAAFPGQGVVAETLNLGDLEGYRTGGTVHLIANNQVGFTTDPRDGRSTRWASDLAKGFDIPIIHVNADDPEACLAAVRLAMAYRVKFQDDVLIDLVGYRRHGHNETDEPGYTQPVMYARDQGDADGARALRRAAGRAQACSAADEADALVTQDLRALRRDPDVASSRRSAARPPSAEPARDAGVTGETRHRAPGRDDHLAQRAAAHLAGRLHGAPEADQAAREAPQRADRAARHRLGARRSAGVRLAAGRRARRSGSPGRTLGAAPSRIVTWCCTTP